MNKLHYAKTSMGHYIRAIVGNEVLHWVANPKFPKNELNKNYRWDVEIELNAIAANIAKEQLEMLIFLLIGGNGPITRLTPNGKRYPVTLSNKNLNILTLAHGGNVNPKFWLDFITTKFSPNGFKLTELSLITPLNKRVVVMNTGVMLLDVDTRIEKNSSLTIMENKQVVSIDLNVLSTASMGESPIRLPNVSAGTLNSWLVSYVALTGYIPTVVDYYRSNDAPGRVALNQNTKETIKTYMGQFLPLMRQMYALLTSDTNDYALGGVPSCQ